MIEVVVILTIMVIVGIGAATFFIKKELQKIKEKQQDKDSLKIVNENLKGLRSKFDQDYQQISQELGKVKEIGRNMKEFQDLLRSPKLRGNLGEQVLKDLLRQVLPQSNFELQYQFEGNKIVDAVIKTEQGLIPIDSKFPMETFRAARKERKKSDKETKQKEFIRAVRKNVRSISKKYILPDQGTVDFALMYIPSEPAYYDIALNIPELLEYAYKKKVYFVSPNTFYYLLKIIMIGLEGAEVEEASRKILSGLKAVKQSSEEFEEELGKLNTHIDNARTASDRVRSKYEKLAAKIERLTSLQIPDQESNFEE